MTASGARTFDHMRAQIKQSLRDKTFETLNMRVVTFMSTEQSPRSAIYADIDTDALAKIQEHVDTTAGCRVRQAPHWSRMSWFAKADEPATLSASTFFEACVALDTDYKVAVILHANGDIGEVKSSPVDQRLRFGSFLDALPGDVLSFVSTRKKARDRDVVVFYTADATKRNRRRQ